LINPPRKEWAAALCALPAAEVKHLATVVTGELEVRDVALPHAGLGLLNLRDGAFAEPYFLGEIPVARAEVMVRSAAGDEERGGALIVDDRGSAPALALVRRGMDVRRHKHNERKKILAATRVDFSLLGQEDDEDEA